MIVEVKMGVVVHESSCFIVMILNGRSDQKNGIKNKK